MIVGAALLGVGVVGVGYGLRLADAADRPLDLLGALLAGLGALLAASGLALLVRPELLR